MSRFIVSLLLVIICFASAQASTLFPVPEEKTTFTARFLRPNYKGSNDNIGTTNGLFELWAQVRIGDRMSLVAGIPAIHASYTSTFYYFPGPFGPGSPITQETDQWRGACPFIGLRTLQGNLENGSQGSFTFGFWLPVLDRKDLDADHFLVGGLADPHNAAKFMAETWTLFLGYHWTTTSDAGFRLDAQGGFEYAVIDDSPNLSNWRYGIAIGLARPILIQAEFTGDYLLNKPSHFFVTDRGDESVALNIGVPGKVLTPSVYVQRPLDKNVQRELDYNLGFQLKVTM